MTSDTDNARLIAAQAKSLREPSITSQQTKRPATLIGRGPLSVSVAFVASSERSVSRTEQNAMRDGMTMRPDTAFSQVSARPTFLHREGRGDEKIQTH